MGCSAKAIVLLVPSVMDAIVTGLRVPPRCQAGQTSAIPASGYTPFSKLKSAEVGAFADHSGM